MSKVATKIKHIKKHENLNKQPCMRCNQRGYVYKVGSAYSQINMGGTKVTCPLCDGDTLIPNKEEIAEIMEKAAKPKKRKSPSKNVKKDQS